ncbi:MAG: putative Tic20 family protein [Psychroserpens sp.]
MRPIGVQSNQNQNIMRQDNQLLVLTHLSQLLTFITGFGGLIVPLVIWATQKETVYNMDEQGKKIVNFQLSMLVYSIICIPFVFVIVGIFGLIGLCLLSFIFPIMNAIKVSHGESPKYPLSLNFIS